MMPGGGEKGCCLEASNNAYVYYRHGPMDQHQGHEQAVGKVSFAATLELLPRGHGC